MTDNGLKVEESFLGRALEGGVTLKVSFSNGERLSGVLSGTARFDINMKSKAGEVTLPKKEISHISYPETLLEDSFFGPAASEEPGPRKSRVQDEFLGRYVTDKTLALFVMSNGDEIRGVLSGYDHYTLALKTNRGQVLIYKHGICTMGPGYRGRPDKNDAG